MLTLILEAEGHLLLGYDCLYHHCSNSPGFTDYVLLLDVALQTVNTQFNVIL
jgi:hypothetical protein